jgi:hypothetical protein
MNRRRRPSRGWMKVKNERNGRKMDERYAHKSNVQLDVHSWVAKHPGHTSLSESAYGCSPPGHHQQIEPKKHRWGTFPKCEAKLPYHLLVGPLF